MGIHFLKTKFRIKAPWELITALLMLLLFMAPFKNILLASLTSNNPVLLLPEETFQWIRLNTPATALLAAEADGQVYIKTDRSTLHLPRPATVNEWADWLEVQRVDYVILTGTDLFLKTKNQNSIHDPLPSEKIQQWMAQMNVPKIYENEAEGTSVYQIHG